MDPRREQLDAWRKTKGRTPMKRMSLVQECHYIMWFYIICLGLTEEDVKELIPEVGPRLSVLMLIQSKPPAREVEGKLIKENWNCTIGHKQWRVVIQVQYTYSHLKVKVQKSYTRVQSYGCISSS